jgi:hypothetical protein
MKLARAEAMEIAEFSRCQIEVHIADVGLF